MRLLETKTKVINRDLYLGLLPSMKYQEPGDNVKMFQKALVEGFGNVSITGTRVIEDKLYPDLYDLVVLDAVIPGVINQTTVIEIKGHPSGALNKQHRVQDSSLTSITIAIPKGESISGSGGVISIPPLGWEAPFEQQEKIGIFKIKDTTYPLYLYLREWFREECKNSPTIDVFTVVGYSHMENREDIHKRSGRYQFGHEDFTNGVTECVVRYSTCASFRGIYRSNSYAPPGDWTGTQQLGYYIWTNDFYVIGDDYSFSIMFPGAGGTFYNYGAVKYSPSATPFVFGHQKIASDPRNFVPQQSYSNSSYQHLAPNEHQLRSVGTDYKESSLSCMWEHDEAQSKGTLYYESGFNGYWNQNEPQAAEIGLRVGRGNGQTSAFGTLRIININCGLSLPYPENTVHRLGNDFYLQKSYGSYIYLFKLSDEDL